MTNLEIKNIFFATWDDYASGEIDDNVLNSHFTKAALVTLKKMFNQYGIDNQYNTDLDPLLKQETLATSASTIDFVDDLTDPFERLVNVQITYSVDGKTYTKVAQPLNDNELMSPYSQGTYRYPRFMYKSALSTSGTANQNSIDLMPAVNITSKVVRYFRSYFPYNFGDSGFEAETSPYGNKTNQMIIDNALVIAGNAYREQQFLQTQAGIQTVNNMDV